MTDLDSLKSLLLKWDVGYTIDFEEGHSVVRFESSKKKVEGQPGRFIDFEFDQRGSFLKIGFYGR